MTRDFLKQFVPLGWKENRLVFKFGSDADPIVPDDEENWDDLKSAPTVSMEETEPPAPPPQAEQGKEEKEKEKTPRRQLERARADVDALIQKRNKIDEELMSLIGCEVKANAKGIHERVEKPSPEQDTNYKKYQTEFLALTHQKDFAAVTTFHEQFLNGLKNVEPKGKEALKQPPTDLNAKKGSIEAPPEPKPAIIPKAFQAYVDHQLDYKIKTEELSDQSLRNSMMSDLKDMEKEMNKPKPWLRWVMARRIRVEGVYGPGADPDSSPDKAMNNLQAKVDAWKKAEANLETTRTNRLATSDDKKDAKLALDTALKARDEAYEDLRLVIEDYFAEKKEIRGLVRNEIAQRTRQICAGYILPPDLPNFSDPKWFLEEGIPLGVRAQPDFLKTYLGEIPHRTFNDDNDLRQAYPQKYLALGAAYEAILTNDRKQHVGPMEDYGSVSQVVNRTVYLNDLKKYGPEIGKLPIQLLTRIQEETEKAKRQDFNAVIARARSRQTRSGPSEQLARR